ncbi:hypothetical protein [Lihuaxuella thermophila]|uniref:hypothetical protein n=1 Tax=Lihuaxuella thermophila TaxID=1173111 RepID=UPI00148025EE|nr:hypothetical protein [Lihuaxuella thermophila]
MDDKSFYAAIIVFFELFFLLEVFAIFLLLIAAVMEISAMFFRAEAAFKLMALSFPFAAHQPFPPFSYGL